MFHVALFFCCLGYHNLKIIVNLKSVNGAKSPFFVCKGSETVSCLCVLILLMTVLSDRISMRLNFSVSCLVDLMMRCAGWTNPLLKILISLPSGFVVGTSL